MTKSATDLVSSDVALGILAASSDCVKLLASDGTVLFMNECGVALNQLEKSEDVLGKNLAEMWPPDEREKVRQAIRRAAAGETTRIEGYCPTAKGIPRWWESSFAPIKSEKPGSPQIVGITRDISERRVAELADRASSTAPSLAFMAGRFGTWSLEIATLELVTSEACRVIFGQDPGDAFSYQDLLRRIHVDDRERMQAVVRRCIDTGDDYDIEYRVVRRDGSVRWVSIRGQPTFDGDGKPLRLQGVSLDITDRMNADRFRLALIELGEKLPELDSTADIAHAAGEALGKTLNISRAGYGTIDAQAETITIERDWNAEGKTSLAGMLQFRDYGSYIEDLKQDRTVMVSDAKLDPRTSATAHALELISASSLVNMPITEHGGLVGLLYLNHAKPRPWTPEETDFAREVGRWTSITIARRRAEHALRRLATSLEDQVREQTLDLKASEARLRAIFETSYQFQFLLSPDGILEDANRISLESINSNIDAVRGKPFWRTPWFSATPGMSPEIEEAIAAVSMGATVRLEIQVNLPVGGLRSFDLTLRPMRNGDAAIIAIVPEATELTERRKAEDELRQSQKMEAVGQLTGGVAHDFNNLLQVISGNLQLIAKDVTGKERAERRLASANVAVARGAKLASQLLAFGRRQPLQPKVMNIGRLVSGMDEMLRRTLGESIEVETIISGGLWNTLVDPTQIENALLNLALNARDAMDGNGRLTIEVCNSVLDAAYARNHEGVIAGQHVMLAVTDTGTGMPPDVIEKVFEPFFSTKPEGRGTGLGLSMVYGFVKQSLGHIKIYSEVGEGTTVKLYLPRVDQREDTVVAVADEPVTGGSETILVVEDDPDVRATTVDILTELGYRVLKARDAASALTVIEAGLPIDLLFTDVVMPGTMKSTELARKARERIPNIQVLFTSGYTENAIVHGGRLDAGVELISKPYIREELAHRVRHVIVGPSG